jgi:hypothetical protein
MYEICTKKKETKNNEILKMQWGVWRKGKQKQQNEKNAKGAKQQLLWEMRTEKRGQKLASLNTHGLT